MNVIVCDIMLIDVMGKALVVVGIDLVEGRAVIKAIDTNVLELAGPVPTFEEESSIELVEGEVAIDVGSSISLMDIPLPMSHTQLASKLTQKSGHISTSSMAKFTAEFSNPCMISLTLLALK